MTDEHTAYVQRVRDDHYLHRLAHILVSIWAGWAWGWPWGLGLFVALFAIILITNHILLVRSGSFKMIRFNRWAWLVVALAAIMWSTATIEQVQ